MKSVYMYVVISILLWSSTVYATPSDAALNALTGEHVVLTTDNGQEMNGRLLAADDAHAVVAKPDGDVVEIDRATIASMRVLWTQNNDEDSPSGANGTSSILAPNVDALNATLKPHQIREKYRRVGVAKRMSGGIVLSTGAISAFSALLVIAINGPRETYQRYDNVTYGDLRVGAVITTIVGTAMTGAGATLVALGNRERREAIQEAKEGATLSLTPAFYNDGGGAQLRLQF